MKNIHEELSDLSAWDLPIELRRIFAKYLRTEDPKIIDSFIYLSLAYSNGKYTDFIRAYMYYELMRRHMLEEMEKLCKKL
ncbi:TPA: hypothetical protein ACGPAW_001971 [Streptococcus suis]|uniref:hypothetical protein n=1 Tax=Streptococcus suis TaxID=1307 RepID=UPI000CA34698|nr:hypothetical protein [Streptococcus suis]AUC90560.1 hypothetical protein CWM22_00760 [Streptococcus suis]MCO8184518.1 hypothetical protein [Streptococcus suis]MCO8215917.1 hypothetical protein [Streptococcus suis]HEM3495803.1 hypothetical protein [Streptococcus suis]HEM3509473.1 hypothetical protein [Streptococcus suis]